MAEQNKKETKEPSILEKTLMREDFRGILATNLMKGDVQKYGNLANQIGNSDYNKFMNSEGANNIKGQLYDEKRQEYKNLGVAGDPTITEQDVSYEVMKQIEEVTSTAQIGEIYQIVKKVSGKSLDIEIPEEVKKMSKMDILKKGINKKGEFEEGKLSDMEKIGFNIQNSLRDIYREANVLNHMQNNYYKNVNENFKALNEEVKKLKEGQKS